MEIEGKLEEHAVRALRIVFINSALFLVFLLFGGALVLGHARFFGVPAYGAPDAVRCGLESAHYRLSVEQQKLLGDGGEQLESYCQSMKTIPEETWARRTYWDYHYYSLTQVSSDAVNFEDIHLFNSRRVPCSADADVDKVVWVFGGSTMQNLETSDTGTIANALCESLTQVLDNNIKVLNFGVGSFFAELEIAKLVALYKQSLSRPDIRPDIVVFYDGYNDSVRLNVLHNWYGLPEDYGQKFALTYSTAPTAWKTAYWIVRFFRESSQWAADNNANPISAALIRLEAFALNEASAGTEKPTSSAGEDEDDKLILPKAFLNDQRVLAGICDSLDIECFTVLQPLLVLREKPVGDIEIGNREGFEASDMAKDTRDFYAQVLADATALENCHYRLVDLSDFTETAPFDAQPHFYDFGHTGFYSGALIGRFLGERLAPLLSSETRPACQT